MWVVADEPRMMRVTEELAREFTEMAPAPGDRGLVDRRLKLYTEAFQEKGFRPATWAKCYCEETGTTYRVNGKHTSHMIASLDSIPEYYVAIESYMAETLEDVAKLYATFDSRTTVRTSSDINKSFAGSSEELESIPKRIINAVVSGLSYEKWLENYGNVPNAKRAGLMLENIEFAKWVRRVFPGDTRAHRALLRVPIVASMVATYRTHIEDSTRFWAAVRDENGATPNLPDRRLAKYLTTTTIASRGANGEGGRVKNATNREIYVKCLHAWNAYRRGATTELRYFAGSDIPKVI